jgi:hypothetical protein
MKRAVLTLFAALLFTTPGFAGTHKFPLSHDGKSVEYASVVGSHRNINTEIRSIAGGFHVSARFSQGDRFTGAHMCSAADFYDKNGQLVAQVRQMVGINATFGHRTKVDNKENDVLMTPDQQARVTFVEIGQAECPIPNKWDAGLKVLSAAVEVIKILNGSP